MVPKIMACRYETDRDETLVAQALATSSNSQQIPISIHHENGRQGILLTSTVVVGIQQGKEGANGEDVVILMKRRHLEG